MKYLKEYEVFESSKSVDLSKVKEAFYNISDRYEVKITEAHVNILVIIEDSKIDFNSIKDDLRSAIDYLNSELGLALNIAYVTDSNFKYGPSGLSKKYDNYEFFLSDFNSLSYKYLSAIKLYFDK